MFGLGRPKDNKSIKTIALVKNRKKSTGALTIFLPNEGSMMKEAKEAAELIDLVIIYLFNLLICFLII